MYFKTFLHKNIFYATKNLGGQAEDFQVVWSRNLCINILHVHSTLELSRDK